MTRHHRKLVALKRFLNENNTNQWVKQTFTAHSSYTRSFKVGASVSAAAKAAIFAEIKVSIDASVSKSVTTGYNNSITFKVPPKKVGHGTFGIWHRKTYGKVYYLQSNCNITGKKWTRARAPKAEGWRVWITDN